MMEKEKNDVVVSTPQGMVENTEIQETPKTGRALLIERLRAAYPDQETDYEDDDAFYSGLENMYNDNEKRVKDLTEGNKRLAEALAREPEAGLFLSQVMEGTPVLTAITNAYGDVLKAVEGDEQSMNEFNAGMQSRRESEKELADIKMRQEQNAEKFSQVISDFLDKKGLDEKGRQDFADYTSNLVDKIYTFEFDEPTLEAIWQAMNYASDVKDAEAMGEVRGRNANIEMQRRSMTSDGVPQLTREMPAMMENAARRQRHGEGFIARNRKK